MLGPTVVCDGFVESVPIRIQSHIHDDHMGGFESSKGFQTIIMSEATRDLLVAEFDADLPVRSNIRGVILEKAIPLQDVTIELLPNEHMLGAVQIVATLRDGTRLAYSGDIGWPLSRIVQTDVLVVDSTYGSPASVRSYSREEVQLRFIDIVASKLAHGPVHIKAHRGTLERALELLDGLKAPAVIASRHTAMVLDVYRRYGYSIGHVIPAESDDGKLAIAGGRYIRIYGKGDGSITGITHGTSIVLSAYMAPKEDPLVEYSPSAYRVALSGHADFSETMEYIRATGAKEVVTDNYRGGHGVELALAIRSRLGIQASPSHLEPTLSWGQ